MFSLKIKYENMIQDENIETNMNYSMNQYYLYLLRKEVSTFAFALLKQIDISLY